MSNLYDVAREAGVSKTLVSRVLNKQSGVSPKSRQKILDAMEKLNYKPNGIARSLVLQRTSIVGVILDSLCEPFFFDLIRGIEEKIVESHFRVIFCSGRGNVQLKEQYIDFFSSGRTDGVIIYGSNLEDVKLIENRVLSNFPVVVVENEIEDMNVNTIVIENAYGSKLAVDHLVGSGCKTVTHITGSLHIKASLDRRAGYEKAMKAHGLEPAIEVIQCEQFGIKEGYEAISTYLRTHGRDRLPDAFYFGADNTAFGGMMALEDAGFQIPQDVMVVGFDDEKPYGLERNLKKLTTIRQPLYDAGVKAVDMLLGQITAPDSGKQKISLFPELVVRETTRTLDHSEE